MSLSYATATLEAIGTTAIVVVTRARRPSSTRSTTRAAASAPILSSCAANDAAGRLTPISELFAAAVGVALRAAELTEGAVDPTVAPALVALGL